MSDFIFRLRRKPLEIRKRCSYHDVMAGGVSVITLRLPKLTLQRMDALVKKHPINLHSRQECIFEMIEACLQDCSKGIKD